MPLTSTVVVGMNRRDTPVESGVSTSDVTQGPARMQMDSLPLLAFAADSSSGTMFHRSGAAFFLASASISLIRKCSKVPFVGSAHLVLRN